MHHKIKTLGLLGIVLAIASSGLAQRGTSPPILPDPAITPGDTLDVTKDDICVPGYTKKVRSVPKAVKEQAYKNYGITHREPGEYEVDHLISLELGGSNSIKNLWPQSYKTHPWNAHVKDVLENRLHKDICEGRMELKEAQQDMAQDWIASYKRIFNTDVPLTKVGKRGKAPKASSPDLQATTGKVWVNTKSGKYFLPGSRYYGKTKEGLYLTEDEAKKQGYLAAKGQ